MPLNRTNKPQKRRHLFISFIILVLLISCRADDNSPAQEDVEALNQWLDSERKMPSEQILEALSTAQTASPVFIQDNPLQADFIRMITAVYPSLYEAGFNEIRVFFLENADQERLDELTGYSGSLQNRSDATDGLKPFGHQAADLLFASNPLYGYDEYIGFLQSVREFNALLPEGSRPLRVLGFPENSDSDESGNTISRIYWLSADVLGGESSLNRENSLFIALHSPLEKTWRWNALIETVSANRSLRDRSYAFTSSDPPFPGWEKDAPEYPVDVYVVAAFDFQGVTPIKNFISSERVDDRLTRMRLKAAIAKASRSYARRLARLEKTWKSVQ